jgi:hypothetical protein
LSVHRGQVASAVDEQLPDLLGWIPAMAAWRSY